LPEGCALAWVSVDEDDQLQRFLSCLTTAAVAPVSNVSLSERELDVLARIAAGDSNKLIARAFDLSPHTVKRHVANILGKLSVETRGQAAAQWRALHGR
jgi:LuxR family transcriptional regulator, maltose regulon positive regulatory protein